MWCWRSVADHGGYDCQDVDPQSVPSCGSSAHQDVDSRWGRLSGLHMAVSEGAA